MNDTLTERLGKVIGELYQIAAEIKFTHGIDIFTTVKRFENNIFAKLKDVIKGD